MEAGGKHIPETIKSKGNDKKTLVFLLASWTILTLSALWFTAKFGAIFPLRDELAWVPYISGHGHVSFGWLWSLHNEHCLFLPRLVYLGICKASGCRFIASALANVMILSFVSILLIGKARKIRKQSSPADVFFPLLFLNWGLHADMLWGFNLQFSLSLLFLTVILLTVISIETEPGSFSWPILIASVVGLQLCGANGMIFSLFLIGWFVYRFVYPPMKTVPVRRNRKAWPVFGAISAGIIAVFYFCQVFKVVGSGNGPAVLPAIRTSVQFLGVGLGQAARRFWPWSLIVVSVFLIAGLGGLLRTRRKESPIRTPFVGLFVLTAGQFAVALSVGWGRSDLGRFAGFAIRYAVLSAFLYALLFLASLYMKNRKTRGLFQYSFVLLLVLTTSINAVPALEYAAPFRQHLEDVQADARSGIPPAALAQRYWESLIRRRPASLARRFVQLYQAGLPPYRRGSLDGKLRAVAVIPAGDLLLPSESVRPPRAQVAGHFNLRPGGEYRFRIRGHKKSSPLIRIDLKIFPDSWAGRIAPELEWRIENVSTNSKSEVVSAGFSASGYVKWDGIITFDIPAVIIDGRADFVFVLKNEGKGNSGLIRIPLYRPASTENSVGTGRNVGIESESLLPKGFLFYGEK